jgi:competence protein ComEC
MSKTKKKSLAALGVVVVAALLVALLYGLMRPDDRVHVFFLDVGQGDAALIQQGNLQILIDGGPSPMALNSELGRLMPFWDRHIELVVLTHPHDDHLTGLVEVMRRYSVGAVLEPDCPGYDSALYEEWLRLVEQEQAQVITARAYQELRLGEMTLTVLNPAAEPMAGTYSDTDNNAVALEVAAGGVSFLFTSDMYYEAEDALLHQRLVPDCDVLKVAHHGSAEATTNEFLHLARPQYAVVSVGQNDFGHPAEETLARLACPVYRTDERGTIEFIAQDGRLWLKTRR